MPDGNLTTGDHDTLVEMRTEMKYVRTELTKMNVMVTDISKSLMLMPGRIEGLEMRITKSETILTEKILDNEKDMQGIADALNRHITEGEKHADKRITRILAFMLVIASLTGGGIATIIEFLIRHG